ncbi:MAG: hypothetical protein M3Q95_13615 [Bacteroidota bacterium]|nr:hypothetical protein [Bacteroidota bacterium]
MEHQSQPFETEGHDLTGAASLEFHDNQSMNSFTSLIPGMDPTRFDPVALKIYLSGETPLITLYAKDKDAAGLPDDKIQVRKFKAPISWPELFRFVKSFDLVLHDGKYPIEDMRVDRK